MKPVYHIATAADQSYYVPMYVMLYSLFRNNPYVVFHVYVLQKDINAEQKSQLQELAGDHGHTINWLQVTDTDVDGYYTSAHIATAAYYRIFLPQLLPAHVTAVLYIDADVIIRSDIQPLLDVDMKQVPLMAVKEPVPYKIDRLGIPSGYDYFNSGVMWMNIAQWRAHNYQSQLLDNINKNGAHYLMHDQDALNELFYNKVAFLDGQWNHQTGYYHLNAQQLEARYGCDANELLLQSPIIHFVGAYKPWLYTCTHPFKPLFLQYLAQTPFTGFAEKPTLSLMMNKTGRRIKHKLKKIFNR